MNWDFHPEALEEYEQAAPYYSERDPELQLRFIESIEDSIERVLEAPTRWRVIDDDVSSVSRACFSLRHSLHYRG
jgi:toxin ParE1/3/4